MLTPAVVILNCWLVAGLAGDAAVRDFELRDTQAQPHRLADWDEHEFLAIVFLGVECPLANLYAETLNDLAGRYASRGVLLVGIDANWHDSLGEIDAFARRHQLRFPLFKDTDGSAADALGATRTPQCVVLDRQRRVRYRGRIDDRYTVTARREQAGRSDLAAALDDLLAGRPVAIPHTAATGCMIARSSGSRETSAAKDDARPTEFSRIPLPAVTFSKDIGPLIARRCSGCHRPGEAAPFSLLSYDDARAWAATIVEVVEQGRMPPWQANPRFGTFANDAHLSADEKRLITAWVEADCPAGDPRGLMIDMPPADASGWAIGAPDCVFELPEPFAVPAQGVIDYHLVTVDPQLSHDVWVTAAEIRPGNRAVVHHASVFLQPPGESDPVEAGSLGSICLAAMAPGSGPTVLPPGMAKLLPAGWKLVFVVHYVPIGKPASDQTRLGLKFTDAADVEHEVATRLVNDEHLTIPPFAADHRVEHQCTLGEDVLLLSLFPHLHVRGKSFRYEALYHDGRSEILLDVPHWNFGWQTRYELAEPKRLAAGTVIRCTAVYDNSQANPANPDPSDTVHTGPQSWDEMFNGYFDVARLTPPGQSGSAEHGQANWRVLVIPVCLALWTLLRRKNRLSRAGMSGCAR
jgi:peroxiredoxin